MSPTGALGVQLRATVSSFGPLLLAQALSLNETQTSVLTLVFKYADGSRLPLLDLSDLRAVLQFLGSEEGKPALESYGGMSPRRRNRNPRPRRAGVWRRRRPGPRVSPWLAR